MFSVRLFGGPLRRPTHEGEGPFEFLFTVLMSAGLLLTWVTLAGVVGFLIWLCFKVLTE
jgi:hypothetical protein